MVHLDELRDQAAILTKGRTDNRGFPANNQNWAFRLKRTSGGQAGVNFLPQQRDQRSTRRLASLDEQSGLYGG